MLELEKRGNEVLFKVRRIFISSLSYFGYYLMGMVIFPIMNTIISDVLFTALSSWFPDIFTEYNIITDRELYLAQKTTLAFISALLSILLIAYLSVRYNNDRYEEVVVKSEGFYRIKDECARYLPKYALADTVASVLVPVIFFSASLIPVLDTMPESSPFSPKNLSNVRNFIFSMNDAVTDMLGLPLGLTVIIGVSLVSHLIIIPSVLKRWRAIWLSDIV